MIGIEHAFEAAALTFDELLAHTGLPRERLQAILAGRWLPSPADRQRVAQALGYDPAQISWGHTMNARVVRYHRFGLPEDF